MTPNKLGIWAIVAAMLLAVTLGTVIAVQERQLEKAKAENVRLGNNQAALLQSLDTARAENGQLMATVKALSLRRDELEELLPSYAAEIKNLRLKLKDVEAVAGIRTETVVQVLANPDTVFVEVPARGSEAARRYRFRDAWVDAVVSVQGDSAHLDLTAHDSLTVVAHRQPRRCLFRRGKITNYTVTAASPYSKISGVSYIEVVEK